jgi:signal recognition particle receptor subunit beta
MHSKSSDGHYLDAGVTPVKLVVMGPFAVGKTTFVGAVSEIRPASTEERLTQAGELVDDLRGLEDRTPPPSPTTSAASPSPTTSCCTCSAPPGSRGSPR